MLGRDKRDAAIRFLLDYRGSLDNVEIGRFPFEELCHKKKKCPLGFSEWVLSLAYMHSHETPSLRKNLNPFRANRAPDMPAIHIGQHQNSGIPHKVFSISWD